jgi:hypothetical protein
MPHDAIERWEWEGGAIAAGASVPAEGDPDDAPERPADAAVQAEGAHQQPASAQR